MRGQALLGTLVLLAFCVCPTVNGRGLNSQATTQQHNGHLHRPNDQPTDFSSSQELLLSSAIRNIHQAPAPGLDELLPSFRNLQRALTQSMSNAEQPPPIVPATPANRAPGCKKLMWFTTLGVRGDGTLLNSYASFAVPALLSALRQAPSLVPHLIYDGPGNPPIVQWWKAMGGIVHYHHLEFYDLLKDVSKEPYHPVGFIDLAGAFLRFDIPLVLKDYEIPADVESEYILYTDVDSMFLKDIDSCSFAPHPNFRMGPEVVKGEIINAGVMYINLKGWGQHRGGMIDWGRAHQWTMVQPILLNYFINNTNGGIGQLEDRFNWKGYWGTYDDAVVIHFHGPKPGVCLECYVLHSNDVKYCADKYHHCLVYLPFWAQVPPDRGAYFVEIMKQFYFYLGLATASMI